MNILFAHNNFPGQFHRLAVELAAHPEHRVVFLSQYRRGDVNVPKVEWVQVPLAADEQTPNAPRRKYLNLLARGERFADSMLKLRNEGFRPDVVYGHVGFGCCIYAPDIFPRAMQMGYFEWYYTNRADTQFFAGNQPVKLTTMAENRQCNMCTLQALKECTVGICPTRWQFDQHPPEFHHKLHILHDGVDTQFFTPREDGARGLALRTLSLPDDAEIVTYATRGLEVYRGFPTFYRSLPEVLEARPNAHAVIMADDRVSYGGKRGDGKTWKEALVEEVKLDESRVHFIPFQPYDQYRELLRASDVHVYMTAPFVLSWSMLEAMSCECLLVASDTEPVREVINHEQNGLLVGFWDHKALARRVADALERREEMKPLRKAARRTIEQKYNLLQLLPRHIELMQAGIHYKRAVG